MRRRERRVERSAIALAGVWVLGAAAVVAEEPVPPVCEKLAHVFHTLALYRDRGDSRESQARWVEERFGAAESSAEARLFERAIDYVHTSRDSAEAIREQVLARCSVDAEGRAVVGLPGL